MAIALLCRSSFGIAFDVDGVILRGRAPIGGSPRALRRLYEQSGTDHDILHSLTESMNLLGRCRPFVFRENWGK